MSHYKPYPAYKDSGVEWLGKVPEHWSVGPAKYYFSFGMGETILSENLTETGTPVMSATESNTLFGHIQNPRLVLEKGDLIIPARGNSIGSVKLVSDKCTTTQTTIYGRSLGRMDSRFVAYHMLAFREILFFFDRTAIPQITVEQVGEGVIPRPSKIDQSRIADFLDRETTRIDTLIAKKTRFIELLKEKRQALITQAVTKGLNPNVKMKDSGVEWLGEVPEHWGVRQLKGVVEIPITDGPHETPDFLDEGIPFVSAEAVSGGFINFEKIRGHISIEDHQRYSKKYKPRRHDIFMIKSGATTGVTAIVETDAEFNIWSPLSVIRCGPNSDPYFILNFMRSQSFLEAVSLNWSFGTQQNIGMGVIGNLQVTVPPLSEQKEISSFLKTSSNRIDELIMKSERSIELMKERRSALVTAVVTGQIDLREITA